MKLETGRLLKKAARSIAVAEATLAMGSPDFALARAYYAMFYVAQALLWEQGLTFSSHGSLHGAFGQQYAKTQILDPKFHRWLLNAFDRRNLADYGIDNILVEDDVSVAIKQAQEFLIVAQHFLGEQSSES